jgi:hypothetical protein
MTYSKHEPWSQVPKVPGRRNELGPAVGEIVGDITNLAGEFEVASRVYLTASQTACAAAVSSSFRAEQSI